MNSIDLTLATNGQWYELFTKYEKYLKKYLHRQDVEDDDLTGEAWLVLESAKVNLDVNKIDDPEHWNLRPLLEYQLNRRYNKTIGRKKKAKVVVVEPQVLDSYVGTSDSEAYQKLLLTELLDKVEERNGPKGRFVLEQLTKGYTRKQISEALNCTKQWTNVLIKSLEPVVAKYL